MNNISEQHETQRFFTLQQLPDHMHHAFVPIIQHLNLETIDIPSLKQSIAFGMPQESGRIRQYAWKLILGYLPKERKRWNQQVQKQEQLYRSFIAQYLNNQKYQEAPLQMNKTHPKWKHFQEDFHLWDQIEKDTCRTHAELAFFSEPASEIVVPFETATRRQKYKLISGDEQLLNFGRRQRSAAYNFDFMTRILFIFARLNPNAVYVQGMNEIVAPIIYMVNSNTGRPVQQSACFFMFNNVMSDILEMHIKDFGNIRDNPVHTRVKKITTILLAIRPKLWQKLDDLKIDPLLYSFRWITLLFSQQFQIFDTLKLWESIFSHDDRVGYTIFVALSLLICSADAINTGDYSEVMAHLKALNKTINVEQIINLASTLYDKYGHTDLTELAEKNRCELMQPKQNKLITLFKKFL